MSAKNKHKKASREEFLNYSADRMSNADRNAFEKKLQKDPFEEDAADGFSSYPGDNIEKDLSDLSFRIDKRINKKSFRIYYRVAASVAILTIISVVLYTRIENRKDRKTGPLIISEVPAPHKEDVASEIKKTSDMIRPEQRKVTVSSEKEKPSQSPDQSGTVGAMKKTEKVYLNKQEIMEEQRVEMVIDVKDEKVTAIPGKNTISRPQVKDQEMVDNIILSRASEPRIIKGVVYSAEDTIPMPGVNIQIKNTNSETVTDLRGGFSIPVLDDSLSVMVARYPGHEEKEVNIKDNRDLMITMVNKKPEEIRAEQKAESIRNKLVFAGRKDRSGSSVTSSPPLPAGGYSSFNDYILKNQKYPSYSKTNRAVVILNFLVNINGRPDSITIMKSPGDEFSSEAIRLLKNGPDWIPAMRNGKYTIEGVQVKILFDSGKE